MIQRFNPPSACLRPLLAAVSIILSAGIVVSCATSIAPAGGPADSTPPEIIETEPAQGATNVRGNEVTLVFSEYVDRNSFQQSLHISPLVETQPEIVWSGRTVRLVFDREFEDEKTYVITAGTSVKDIRAGNRMSSSFTLAFSTGDSLDNAFIRGQVFEAAAGEISIFAYAVDGINPDTLNPSSLKPSYAVQTDANGGFQLDHLAAGTYRVFAVRDKQKNFLYDMESDDIGIAQSDITAAGAGDSAATALRFRMSIEDTTAPYIQSIRPITSNSLELRISEQPFTDPPLPQSIILKDSSNGIQIPAIDVSRAPGKKNTYFVFSQVPLNDTRYMIGIDTLLDLSGNVSPYEQHSITFAGGGTADTAAPSLISVYPARQAAGVELDSAFSVEFSKPVMQGIVVTVIDTSGNPVALNLGWIRPHLVVIGHAPLTPGMKYTMCIDLKSVADSVSGIIADDSLYCYGFTAAEAETIGSISGTVTDERQTGKPVKVTARGAGTTWTATTTVRNGAYAFPKVPEGKYTISAFSDADTNGVYSHGKAFPYKPSERFGILQDTVRVRARWETAKRDFTIP